MESIGLLSLLGICSLEDIRYKRVGIFLVLSFAVGGIVIHLLEGKRSIEDIAGGILIGIVLFIFSVLSREKIGKGDALIVCTTGIYLGFWSNLLLLWTACFLAALFGVGFIIKGKKEARLPFVPFLLVVYVMFLFLSGGELVS